MKTRSLPAAISAIVILAVLSYMPMKALADALADAKSNLDLAQMDVISGCDMARTLLGDHPADPGAEGVLAKCDQSILSVKHECDTPEGVGLKTCSDSRISEYMVARGL
jgi:hypothetical protein